MEIRKPKNYRGLLGRKSCGDIPKWSASLLMCFRLYFALFTGLSTFPTKDGLTSKILAISSCVKLFFNRNSLTKSITYCSIFSNFGYSHYRWKLSTQNLINIFTYMCVNIGNNYYLCIVDYLGINKESRSQTLTIYSKRDSRLMPMVYFAYICMSE